MTAVHLGVLLVLVLVVIAPIAVGIDASRRGMRAGAWAAGVFLLMIVFLPLYLIMRKPVKGSGRECPACGENVARGLTVCPTCRHDFAAAARGPAATP